MITMVVKCTKCHSINPEPKYQMCPACRSYYRNRYKKEIVIPRIHNSLRCKFCENEISKNETWLFDNQLYIYCPTCLCFLSSLNITAID